MIPWYIASSRHDVIQPTAYYILHMSDPSTDHADHFTDHTGRFLGPAYSAQVSTGLTYNVRELRAQRRHVLGDGDGRPWLDSNGVTRFVQQYDRGTCCELLLAINTSYQVPGLVPGTWYLYLVSYIHTWCAWSPYLLLMARSYRASFFSNFSSFCFQEKQEKKQVYSYEYLVHIFTCRRVHCSCK